MTLVETGTRGLPGAVFGPQEIAQVLGDITLGTMYRQLSRWAEDDHLRKCGPGIYTAVPQEPVNSLA
ncbi:hypothetical protein [Streptomyces sp. NPDC050538]|uniref:hypothetical protein n=1 Tax=Streptomyces sp. NPDC050538 TaxID=3365627 RepID=UPI0037960E2C